MTEEYDPSLSVSQENRSLEDLFDNTTILKTEKRHWYKRPGIVIPVVLLSIFAIVVGGIVAGAFYVNSSLRHIPLSIPERSNKVDDDEKREQINVLVLGSDSRESGGDPTDWKYGAQRSDVMMLVNISADRKRISAMSIPRDSWVAIPGHDEAKINAAFSYGGPKLTIQTVENLLGVHVDHFAVVDFEGFKKITDLLGGVSIQTTQGVQEMNGDEALAFVRERKSLPHGDFDRVRRQQAWIRAIMENVGKKKVLSSPSTLKQLLDVVVSHSAMDEGLSLVSLMQIAYSLEPGAAGNLTFFTAPTLGTGWSPDGKQSIVNLNLPLVKALGAQWVDNNLPDFISGHPEIQVLGNSPVN